MDLDAYIELHWPEWEELAQLLGRTGHGTSRLTATLPAALWLMRGW